MSFNETGGSQFATLIAMSALQLNIRGCSAQLTPRTHGQRQRPDAPQPLQR